MPNHAAGQFEIEKWDEETYEERGDEARLTQASVTQTFHGDVEGEGAVEFLMMYADKSTASFVGQQRIVGSIGKRSGSFVLHLNGNFDGGKAEATWSIVPGSGTGELQGIRGEGTFSAPLGNTASYSLEYELD